ncbi:hypothetical protein IKG60_01085 [Candidatus Saccharibacteria bacterium]|nr:hypothetical protein [Candidatus Saccharibacteria bacterium]
MSANVAAANCGDVSKKENEAIWFACRESGTQGVLWISSDESSRSVSSTVKVNDWTHGKVTVYVHGAVFRGDGSPATYVEFVKWDKKIEDNEIENFSTYKPLDVPKEIERRGNSERDIEEGTIKSKVTEATLKISGKNGLIKTENSYTINDEGNRVYNVGLQAYRCFQGYKPETSDKNCFSSTSRLKIEVKVLTLYGKSRDKIGKLLGNNPNPDEEVAPGGKGEVAWKNINGYKFIGWSKDPTGDPTEGNAATYVWRGMTKDETIYAVYEKDGGDTPEPSDCPSAATPSTYTNSGSNSGISSTDSKVQNPVLSTGWKSEVWAKPGDNIDWSHCYFPGAQRPYQTLVTFDPIPDSHPTSSSTTTLPSTNDEFQGKDGYVNKYSVESDFGYGTGVQNLSVGDAQVKNNQNQSTVTIYDPGSQLSETMKGWIKSANVGSPSVHEWQCNWVDNNCSACGCDAYEKDEEGNETGECAVCGSCYKDTCRHAHEYITSSIDEGPVDSTARVYVPYNYTNRTVLEQIDKKTKFFYAGEKVSINHTIYTDPKTNTLTSPTEKYATIVRKAQTKARLCVGATCYETNARKPKTSQEGTLNPNGNLAGSEEKETIDLNVPDLPAGTEVCYSTAVYPANSGADGNYTDDRGSNTWSDWSQPICVRVAKRPSIEVLGGNVYANGEIRTGLSVKNLLYGAYNEGQGNLVDPSSASNGKPYVFGSWGELGVMASGTVRGFASGNGLGYNKAVASSDVSGMTLPNRTWNPDVNNYAGNYDGGRPGGANVATICPNLSSLTITNDCQNGNAVGTNNSGSKQSDIDLNNLKILAEGQGNWDAQALTGNINLASGGASYYSADGDAVIRGDNYLVSDSYIVVSVAGTATIASDLVIGDGESFDTMGQVPKLVIYANNIKINCDVKRLDAVLVADGTVTTCAPEDGTDFNGLNNADNPYDDNKNLPIYSNQLVVNGAIIAKGLDATRTYGAARGQNSMVSAEVINFDPTLYLWSGLKGEKKNSQNSLNGDLETTYVRELAPRR